MIRTHLTYYFIGLLLFMASAVTAGPTDIMGRLDFKQLSTRNGLPSDEVQKIYQDREGFMWFATWYGLCKYDGYTVNQYKSSIYTPNVFSNNNITCLAEDQDHNLWVGTREGINIFNKQTGRIRKGIFDNLGSNVVSCLLVTSDNTVWLGSENGLFKYDRDKDSLVLYAYGNTDNKLRNAAIKDLVEDSDGDIWIGTWSDGLYRYSPREDTFYKYPRMNARNSAHTIYEDSDGNFWIGGWAEGLFRLHNPKDMNRVSWTVYRHKPDNASALSDDIVYDICEDINNHTLWVGTRSGLSIMSLDTPGSFVNYKPIGSPYYLPCNEVNSILRDSDNNMWIGALGGGVLMADTHQRMFDLHEFDLSSDGIPTNAVRTIFVDSNENIWLGVGSYGLALHNRTENTFQYYTKIPEFSQVTSMATVYSIIERKESGEIWIGTYDDGLFVYNEGKKVVNYTDQNTDFIDFPCITALFEDSKGNCWVGTRTGLGVKCRNGKGLILTDESLGEGWMESAYVCDMTEDDDGNIWVATSNRGIVKISGDVKRPESLLFMNFNVTNDRLLTKNVMCIYCDRRGRLWAGTESHGLFLYDVLENKFFEKNSKYNLPADMIGSVEEDLFGNLWLGTNRGLIRLYVTGNGESDFRVFTSTDGLQDNFFIPQSSFVKGNELFFGGYKGYNSFHPENLKEDRSGIRYAITDIKIFNRSLDAMEDDVRERISLQTPVFTDKLELPYRFNNVSIEFASLTYRNPELNKYAFKLEGFDKEWQYTDAQRHFAYYNNLKSGTYTFLLKATNENGIWSSDVRKLTVVVHPPLWATWWAYCVYSLVLLAVVFVVFRTVRYRMILKNRIQLQEMEKEKAEELNHSKLQFFTNITHELLTPLTIISATIDELKLQAPQYGSIYGVISANIQRLIRLLQQILEFRKAETGNLKLRVSSGDIATFLCNEAEAFQPLIKKHKLHFSILCDPESINGFFDPDKLDKIIYNLLSNAAKYNKEGGYIQMNASLDASGDHILISVKDNGKGISKEKQKTLFKRFYEGDYREFKTIGTGIGLSLTRDLVELHGGRIWVESEPGQGTAFFVRLPIDRSYFKDDEIAEETLPALQTVSGIHEEASPKVHERSAQKHSILLLEDNDELLRLLMSLLGRDYNIFTAGNGREGIVIMENEDVDLIVSDIMMPEMDGIEFTRYVKGKLEFSHIPIILLTAKTKEEDRAGAYESGADGFIGKPFNLTVLHARIRNLLKSKERMAKDFKNQLVFEVNDLNYTSIDEDFIQRAIGCVHRHLDDPEFDQSQFIEEMGTSKSTLYKKLKSLTGLNTSAFIRNIRLKAAVKIMEDKRTIRVSELAYAVGFNDPKYFSSCFKKEFNMLPSEYIERFIPDSGV